MEIIHNHIQLVFLTLILAAASVSGNLKVSDNCQPPSIATQGYPKMYFIANEEVQIPCTAKGNATLKFEWLKNGLPLDISSAANRARMSIKPTEGTFVLTESQDEDSGFYQCVVTNMCGTSLSQKTELLHAKMDPFPQLDKPTEIRRMVGTSAKLICTPPESQPKAHVSWILLDSPEDRIKNLEDPNMKNTGFKTVENSKRVTTDYDGNLYITNVRKEDEQNGRTYVCQAENLVTRSANKGEDKLVKIIGEPSQATMRGLDLMWHSDTETTVLEGKTARMKCIFSGNPEPTMILWERIDGRFDDARMVREDLELTISNVLTTDEGSYRCTAKGARGDSKSHTFKLTVHSLPQWKEELRELRVGPDEDVEFRCSARGYPEPEVEWFINGKPFADLTPDVSKRELKGNVLHFYDLEQTDSLVVQCNASNVYGYIWADKMLYVEAKMPNIKVKPELEKEVAEGQELRVNCEVDGKPNPVVTWMKNDQTLNHERYQISDIGNLLIKEAEKNDAGQYRCIATNKYGRVWAGGSVIVRDKTRILSGPVSREVSSSGEVSFKCSARTDSNKQLSYTWLKDGVPIKAGGRISIKTGVLTIKGTTSKDTANYTCLAANTLDNATASATLKVKAVPDPPENVSVVVCRTKQAKLTWHFDKSMSNFQDMHKFIVEYITDFDVHKSRWQHAIDVPVLEPFTSDMHEAVLNLSPFAKYKFRVRAVNSMGMSKPSAHTYSWCDTPRSLPEKNPDNVRTDEQYTGYLVIKWDTLDQIDLNGPNFTYVVQVQKQGEDDVDTYQVDDYTVGEKWIPVNDTYQSYLVSVRSSNQVGNTMKTPETHHGYSGEGVPLVVPQNFELDPLVNVTATSATFQWDAVDTSVDAMQGLFSGYKIRFWKAGQKETTLHAHIVEGEPDAAIGRRKRQSPQGDGKIRGSVANLPSYSNLEADVVAINKNFESNGSNVIPIKTPEGVPGPVGKLEAINRGSHHFLLEWTRPKEPNGIITGYEVSFRKIKKLDFLPKEVAFKHLEPDTVRVKLKGLEPFTTYRIYIHAFTKKGPGKEYFIDVRTNSEAVEMVSPIVKHVVAGETDANITFDVLSPSKSSRQGQLYKIQYKKKKAEMWKTSDRPVEDGLMWGSLDHLEPNTQYQVRVLALAHENAGNQATPGKAYTFKTGGVGPYGIALRLADSSGEEKAKDSNSDTEHTLAGAKKATFLTAGWFIGMMVAIAILLILLIIICIIKRNRGDNYPVQEKERLRGNYDDNPDHFNGYGKPDENGLAASSSFDQDGEKVPLDAESDSLDYGDDDASKFNEDGSFIGQYGRGEKANDPGNSSSIV